jgi:transcriptional regulator with XRE-family HTH domain
MAATQKPRRRATREFASWLAIVASEAREEHGISLERVAADADVSVSTVRNFEEKGTWPHKVNRLMAVYAKLTGLGDGRLLFAQAVSNWQEHGRPPLADPDQEPDLLAEAEQDVDALVQQVDRTSTRRAGKSSGQASRGQTRRPKRRAS